MRQINRVEGTLDVEIFDSRTADVFAGRLPTSALRESPENVHIFRFKGDRRPLARVLVKIFGSQVHVTLPSGKGASYTWENPRSPDGVTCTVWVIEPVEPTWFERQWLALRHLAGA